MGVTCIVVRDTVDIDGVLIEDTVDWFAQDVEGNVWYFGEISKTLRMVYSQILMAHGLPVKTALRQALS